MMMTRIFQIKQELIVQQIEMSTYLLKVYQAKSIHNQL